MSTDLWEMQIRCTVRGTITTAAYSSMYSIWVCVQYMVVTEYTGVKFTGLQLYHFTSKYSLNKSTLCRKVFTDHASALGAPVESLFCLLRWLQETFFTTTCGSICPLNMFTFLLSSDIVSLQPGFNHLFVCYCRLYCTYWKFLYVWILGGIEILWFHNPPTDSFGYNVKKCPKIRMQLLHFKHITYTNAFKFL